MERAEAIAIIERSYPADSQKFTTREIAIRLLARARAEAHDWRTEPDAVLDRYAELCLETEQWAGTMAERAKRYGV